MLHVKRVLNLAKITWFLLILCYFISSLILYKFCSNKIDDERFWILQQSSDKIASISIEKLNSILNKISTDTQNQDLIIENNLRDLKACHNRCIKYSLFRFGDIIDKHIPKYIHFQIKLNNNLFYLNAKNNNNQLEKIYPINNNHNFTIGVSLTKDYEVELESRVMNYFWIINCIIFVGLIFIFFLYQLLIKYLAKSFKLDYQSYYKQKMGLINKQNLATISTCRSSLMNEIWNKDFSKQKDLEINNLFALELNKFALENTENFVASHKQKQFQNNFSYSIILYRPNQREEISLVKLVRLFTARFEQDNQNIEVKIISNSDVAYFCSETALYQIIYSIIHYLIYVLNKQSFETNKFIKINIDNFNKEISLEIEYNGLIIKNKKELLGFSKGFFQSHANPYILNINNIFSLLESNNYACNFSYDKFNNIKIIKKIIQVSRENKENNIIFLSTEFKKKNE